MDDTDDFHFFAASMCTWAVTTPNRDLRALLKLMDSEELAYNLYFVPVPYDKHYDIEFFRPKVEGTRYAGTFEPKKKRKK